MWGIIFIKRFTIGYKLQQFAKCCVVAVCNACNLESLQDALMLCENITGFNLLTQLSRHRSLLDRLV